MINLNYRTTELPGAQMSTISIHKPLSFTISDTIDAFLDKNIDYSSQDGSYLSAKNILVYAGASCVSVVNVVVATIEIVATSSLALIACTAMIFQQKKSHAIRVVFTQALAYCSSSKVAIDKLISSLFSSRVSKPHFHLKYSSLDLCNETIKAHWLAVKIFKVESEKALEENKEIKGHLIKLLTKENERKHYPDSDIMSYRIGELKSFIDENIPLLYENSIEDIQTAIKNINISPIPSSIRTQLIPSSFIDFIFDFRPSLDSYKRQIDKVTQDIVETAYREAPELFLINENIDRSTGRPKESVVLPIEEQKRIGAENISSLHPCVFFNIANLVQLVRASVIDVNLEQELNDLDTIEKEVLLAKLLTLDSADVIMSRLDPAVIDKISKIQKKIGFLANTLIQPINDRFSEGYQNALTTF